MSVLEVHGVTEQITLTEGQTRILVSAPGCKLTPIEARYVARKLYRLARNLEARIAAVRATSQ